MNAQPLIHPNLFTTLGAFYPLTAEIQRLPSPDTQNADGEALRSDWTTVTGLTGIPARVEVYISRRGNEVRDKETVYERRSYYIQLAGWFPEIREKDRIITTEPKLGLSETYDIVSVGSDSQNFSTKLFGEVIA
jgi:hypothetical protein